MTEMTIPIKIKTFQNILEYMEKLSYLSYLSLSHILFCGQSLKTTGGFNNDRDSNYNSFHDCFLYGVYRMTRGRHTPPASGPVNSLKTRQEQCRARPRPEVAGFFFSLSIYQLSSSGGF